MELGDLVLFKNPTMMAIYLVDYHNAWDKMCLRKLLQHDNYAGDGWVVIMGSAYIPTGNYAKDYTVIGTLRDGVSEEFQYLVKYCDKDIDTKWSLPSDDIRRHYRYKLIGGLQEELL